jgi:drug/metabolite transporter (DMT)-like permease
MPEGRRRAYLYGLFSVGLWSTVATAFKLTLKYAEPLQLLMYAALTSAAALGFHLVVTGKIAKTLRYPRRLYALSLMQGILNPFLYYSVLFKAYDILPAQVAQPLNYTWAITLSVLSVFLLGRKLGFRDIISGIVSYTGVVVVVTRGRLDAWAAFDPLGVALALLSTIIWSLSWILNTRDPREPAESLFLSFVFGLPFIAGACALTSSIHIDTRALAGSVYVGLFEMGITFVFWLKALRISENTARIANLIFLSPFLSLVLIHHVVGEEIHPASIAGLALITIGLLAQGYEKACVRG